MNDEENKQQNPIEQANNDAQKTPPLQEPVAPPVNEPVTPAGGSPLTELPQSAVPPMPPVMAPERKSSKKALYLIIILVLVMVALVFVLVLLRTTRGPQEGPVIPTPTVVEEPQGFVEEQVGPIQSDEDLNDVQSQVENMNPDEVGNELNQIDQDASVLE